MRNSCILLLCSIFLLGLFAVNSSAEPYFGYIINEETNECIHSYLNDDGGPIPEFRNCKVIRPDYPTIREVIKNYTNDTPTSDIMNEVYMTYSNEIGCKYVGCNQCSRNRENDKYAKDIGCIKKGIFKFVVALVSLLIIAGVIYFLIKRKRSKVITQL